MSKIKEKHNFLEECKVMASIMNPGVTVLPNVSMPKNKRKYTERRQSDKPRQHLEKDLEIRVIKWLRLHGAICGRVKTMSRQINGKYILDPYLFIGFPDVACFLNGFWFLEIKSPTGTVSERQEQFQQCCRDAGINYLVVKELKDIDVIIKNNIA